MLPTPRNLSPAVGQPAKRPRGRPRKHPVPHAADDAEKSYGSTPDPTLDGHAANASIVANAAVASSAVSSQSDEKGSPPCDSAPLVCAAAACGSLLAVVTLVPCGSSWQISKHRTRTFHLAGRQQTDLREFARQVYEFSMLERVTTLTFCRAGAASHEQGLADEVRIEALLSMIYGLDVILRHHDDVKAWSNKALATTPGISIGPLGSIAIAKAVELAQYEIAGQRKPSSLA